MGNNQEVRNHIDKTQEAIRHKADVILEKAGLVDNLIRNANNFSTSAVKKVIAEVKKGHSCRGECPMDSWDGKNEVVEVADEV